MEKKSWFKLVILSLSNLVLIAPSFAADPPLPTPVGRVVWVKGTLSAEMENKEKRILQKLSVIYLHDTLVTDDKSQAQIAFTDNSLTTFREQTRFSIDQYVFKQNAKKGTAGKYVMNLIEGGFRTITGLIAKNNPSDYTVNTPVATIGVRGTEYAVYYHNGVLDVGYYKGTPCVKDQKGGSVCLNEQTKYAQVPGAGQAVVPLSQQPAGLAEQLTIIPAKISPFGNFGGGSSGPITSFCIQ